ncbi:MAG TPA: hypothetical protein VL128_12730 [Candidatus Eisenbacteria bacterium]|nr:hypothetical protein [Candidatus Eisenbacteria bacterium]
MSTEHPNHGATNGRPEHMDVSFEAKDVQPSPILKFLFWLGVTVVLSFVLSLGVYDGLKSYFTSTYVQPPPSRPTGLQYPPEPRLQGVPGHLADAQQDMRDKVEADTKANNQLGWVDEKAGIAEIPVKDAMQLIVEKGLPAVKAVAPAESKK